MTDQRRGRRGRSGDGVEHAARVLASRTHSHSSLAGDDPGAKRGDYSRH
ncbi:hypothetical protein [Natrinema sp. H-ect4]